MQTNFRTRGLARERDCTAASLDRAWEKGKVLGVRGASKDSEHASSVTSKGSTTLAFSPSSASNSVATTVRDAGRKGGLSCLRNWGRDFFVEIGKKGQLEMRRKHPGMARNWGKRGGRPRKPTLDEIVGEKRKNHEGGSGPACVALSPPTHYTAQEQEEAVCDDTEWNVAQP
jgi:general stress protein YciG